MTFKRTTRPSAPARGLLMALALGLAAGASATAPAMADIRLRGGGPAYEQAGFTQSDMLSYASARVQIEHGGVPEQVFASTPGIDARLYRLITKAQIGEPAIQMTVHQMMVAAEQRMQRGG